MNPSNSLVISHLTAREALRFTACFCYKGPARALEKRIAETLDLVGLGDKANRLRAIWPVPVVAMVLWTVLFLGAALWQFGREEF